MPNTLGNVVISSNVPIFNTSATITAISGKQITIGSKQGGGTAFTGDFSVGDEVILHNTMATNTANFCSFELGVIDYIPNGTTIILTKDVPAIFEAGRCQIVKMPNFNDLTINSGVTVTTNPFSTAYNGGLLVFRILGKLVLNGTIDVTGKGFPVTISTPVNGRDIRDNINSIYWAGSGGTNRGIGGNGGTTGGNGSTAGSGNTPKSPIVSDPDLLKIKKLPFGGAGGYGYYSHQYSYNTSMVGGSGGGGIFIISPSIEFGINGAISANGNGGTVVNVSSNHDGGSGGGAGGSIIIQSPRLDYGSNTTFVGCTGGGGGGNTYDGSNLVAKSGASGTNSMGGVGGAGGGGGGNIYSTNATGAGGAGYSYSFYTPQGHGVNGNQPPGGGGGGYGFLSLYTGTETVPNFITPYFKKKMFSEVDFIIPFPDVPDKADNLSVLRQKINEFRVSNGLSQIINWTDPLLISGNTPIKAVHWNEVMDAIQEVYVYNSMTVPDTVKPMFDEPIKANNSAHTVRDLGSRLYRIRLSLQNKSS